MLEPRRPSSTTAGASARPLDHISLSLLLLLLSPFFNPHPRDHCAPPRPPPTSLGVRRCHPGATPSPDALSPLRTRSSSSHARLWPFDSMANRLHRPDTASAGPTIGQPTPCMSDPVRTSPRQQRLKRLTLSAHSGVGRQSSPTNLHLDHQQVRTII